MAFSSDSFREFVVNHSTIAFCSIASFVIKGLHCICQFYYLGGPHNEL